MRRATTAVLAAVAALALLAPAAAPAGGDASYRVIVHPDVKGTQIPRTALTSIFLKKAAKWGDGSPCLPVDQSVRSRVRQSFSADIFEKGMVEVQVYWQRQMATGVTPPPVKPSDEEVVTYVASTPGSIGYVSTEIPLPASVKTVAIID